MSGSQGAETKARSEQTDFTSNIKFKKANQKAATENSFSPAYLYLHPLIQRSVHQSVEGQEQGSDGVEESVPVLAVPIESEKQRPRLHQSYSSLEFASEALMLAWQRT